MIRLSGLYVGFAMNKILSYFGRYSRFLELLHWNTNFHIAKSQLQLQGIEKTGLFSSPILFQYIGASNRSILLRSFYRIQCHLHCYYYK